MTNELEALFADLELAAQSLTSKPHYTMPQKVVATLIRRIIRDFRRCTAVENAQKGEPHE
jgi:hypothetical protein